MKAVVYYKNGKTETFNFMGLDFISISKDGFGICLDKLIKRPPCEYPVKHFYIRMKDIEKFEILKSKDCGMKRDYASKSRGRAAMPPT